MSETRFTSGTPVAIRLRYGHEIVGRVEHDHGDHVTVTPLTIRGIRPHTFGIHHSRLTRIAESEYYETMHRAS